MMQPAIEEPTKLLEVHENNRYWVATGWGGLLPNDRGKFSYTDGSKSWKTLEEIPLPLGYEFAEDSEWHFDDQYFYARDFTVSAIDHAKAERGALHFVRFRLVTRKLQLNPNVFCQSHQCCDYADSKKVFGLAKYLLDAVTYCCILSDFKLSSIEKYKRQVLELVRDENHVENPDAFFRFEVLLRKVGEFVDEKRQNITHLFSDLPTFANRKNIEDFEQQLDKVKPYFNERTRIAMLVIKNLDSHFQMHCDQIGCKSDCQFRWVHCQNPGCTTVISKLYESEHDEKCPFKIVSCECGDSFPRTKERQHQTQVCSLRQTSCPFSKIGCTTVAQAKDMGEHVSNETSSHLLLAFDRMMEYESTMRNMHQRIQALEAENVELKKLIAVARESTKNNLGGTDRALSTTQRKLKSVEHDHKKETKRLHGDIKKLQNELTKLKSPKK